MYYTNEYLFLFFPPELSCRFNKRLNNPSSLSFSCRALLNVHPTYQINLHTKTFFDSQREQFGHVMKSTLGVCFLLCDFSLSVLLHASFLPCFCISFTFLRLPLLLLLSLFAILSFPILSSLPSDKDRYQPTRNKRCRLRLPAGRRHSAMCHL